MELEFIRQYIEDEFDAKAIARLASRQEQDVAFEYGEWWSACTAEDYDFEGTIVKDDVWTVGYEFTELQKLYAERTKSKLPFNASSSIKWVRSRHINESIDPKHIWYIGNSAGVREIVKGEKRARKALWEYALYAVNEGSKQKIWHYEFEPTSKMPDDLEYYFTDPVPMVGLSGLYTVVYGLQKAMFAENFPTDRFCFYDVTVDDIYAIVRVK